MAARGGRRKQREIDGPRYESRVESRAAGWLDRPYLGEQLGYSAPISDTVARKIARTLDVRERVIGVGERATPVFPLDEFPDDWREVLFNPGKKGPGPATGDDAIDREAEAAGSGKRQPSRPEIAAERWLVRAGIRPATPPLLGMAYITRIEWIRGETGAEVGLPPETDEGPLVRPGADGRWAPALLLVERGTRAEWRLEFDAEGAASVLRPDGRRWFHDSAIDLLAMVAAELAQRRALRGLRRLEDVYGRRNPPEGADVAAETREGDDGG